MVVRRQSTILGQSVVESSLILMPLHALVASFMSIAFESNTARLIACAVFVRVALVSKIECVALVMHACSQRLGRWHHQDDSLHACGRHVKRDTHMSTIVYLCIGRRVVAYCASWGVIFFTF